MGGTRDTLMPWRPGHRTVPARSLSSAPPLLWRVTAEHPSHLTAHQIDCHAQSIARLHRETPGQAGFVVSTAMLGVGVDIDRVDGFFFRRHPHRAADLAASLHELDAARERFRALLEHHRARASAPWTLSADDDHTAEQQAKGDQGPAYVLQTAVGSGKSHAAAMAAMACLVGPVWSEPVDLRAMLECALDAARGLLQRRVRITQRRTEALIGHAIGLSRREARHLRTYLLCLVARLLCILRDHTGQLDAIECPAREHPRTPLRSARTCHAPPLPRAARVSRVRAGIRAGSPIPLVI